MGNGAELAWAMGGIYVEAPLSTHLFATDACGGTDWHHGSDGIVSTRVPEHMTKARFLVHGNT
jgi:hypothetical protein